MAPCLEDCPNQIIACVVELLPLCDICSLRQTCRILATKATQHTFKSFFRQRRVFLTRDSLQRLIEATKPGQLGCLLHSLTVTGVVINTKRLAATVRNTARIAEQTRNEAQRHLDILKQRQAADEELRGSGLDIALLCEVFSNLAARGKPLCISLRVIVYRTDSEQMLSPVVGGSWKLIWQSAAHTFHTALQAMVASRIQVEALDVYRSDDRCSVACNEINMKDGNSEFAQLPSMESLALSFSDRNIARTTGDTGISGDSADEIGWEAAENERGLRATQAEADTEGNFIGLANLLKSCPNLTTLELHHYYLKPPARVHLHRERFLQRILETAPLPRLQNLTLRGLLTRERDLLALIERSPLRVLSLENVAIVTGSFGTIFEHCTSSSSQIERLHFDDLFEMGLIQFDGPGTLKYHVSDQPRSNTLNRSGMEVKQAISYYVPQGPVPGNPFLAEWRQQIRRLYGPP